MEILFQFGRRIPLIVGGVWQSAWLFVFAAAGTVKVPQDNPGIGQCMDISMPAFTQAHQDCVVMIVSACFFIFGYAMTWAPYVSQYTY